MYGLTSRNMGQVLRSGRQGRQDACGARSRAGGAGRARPQLGSILFSLENDGELVVFRTSRTGLEELRRYKVADAETWAQPAISAIASS